jgi:trk system potassium uptake protein TrkA
MRVIVAGAGKVGTYIATDLTRAGHEVLLLEKSRDVVERERALPEHAGVEFRVADACELTSLAKAGLNTADVVAAVTGDDVARVNHPKNEWLFNETWGVDVSVSTPHLLTALVEEAVSVGSLVRLLQFEGGKARLEEVTLAPQSPAVGKTVSELGMPRDSTLVAIVRDEHVIVPRGDTSLQAGDEVLVLLTPDSEAGVHTIFV